MEERKLDMAKLEAAELEIQKIFDFGTDENDLRAIYASCERVKKLTIIKMKLRRKINDPSNYLFFIFIFIKFLIF